MISCANKRRANLTQNVDGPNFGDNTNGAAKRRKTREAARLAAHLAQIRVGHHEPIAFRLPVLTFPKPVIINGRPYSVFNTDRLMWICARCRRVANAPHQFTSIVNGVETPAWGGCTAWCVHTRQGRLSMTSTIRRRFEQFEPASPQHCCDIAYLVQAGLDVLEVPPPDDFPVWERYHKRPAVGSATVWDMTRVTSSAKKAALLPPQIPGLGYFRQS